MARCKHSRSRAKVQSQQHSACHTKHPCCRCVQCVTDRNLSGKNDSSPASLGHRNSQDVEDSIEYHWKILSTEVKQFLLKRPGQLNLRMIVSFWSEPHRTENAKGICAISLSGSSWFLALNYLFLDRLAEARALVLHGSFMRECAHTRIEEISALCNTSHQFNEDVLSQELTHYHDGFMATLTKQSMDHFLQKVLPADYRRRMSFACQAGQFKGHSIVGDYVNLISYDWNGTSSSSFSSAQRRSKGGDNSTIEVTLVNSAINDKSTVTFAMSATFKTVLNEYADEHGLSLRSSRFTHAGKLLFLSSAGSKTVEQLGIKHGDVIYVSSMMDELKASPPAKVTQGSAESPKKSNTKSSRWNRKSKGKKKKQHKTRPAYADTDSYEQDKIQHSKQLSQVFDEAQPILKSIRQNLNSMNIERTLPKRKRSSQSKLAVGAVWNPSTCPNSSTACIEGKVGKTHFDVQVGEPCNLYKTMKRPAFILQQRPLITDLHGLSKEEALSELNSSLPKWTDIAMKGSYPFVIQVKIVCGAGNQILSEEVGGWIRQNKNVSNAPKNSY